MDKKELPRIALRLFNKGYMDFETIRYSNDMYDATEKEIEQCCDYTEEIIRTGNEAYCKKYCIK